MKYTITIAALLAFCVVRYFFADQVPHTKFQTLEHIARWFAFTVLFAAGIFGLIKFATRNLP